MYLKNAGLCLDLKLIALSFWITGRGEWEQRDRRLLGNVREGRYNDFRDEVRRARSSAVDRLGCTRRGRLAKPGSRLLFAKSTPWIGEPVHCTGVLSADAFDEFDLPRTAILNPLATVSFVSPAGLQVSYSPPTVQAVVIDRAAFDCDLAAKATAAGAENSHELTCPVAEHHQHGVQAVTNGSVVYARLAVLASGASYALQRRLGLGLPRAYLHTAQRELPADALGPVELTFRR